MSDAPNGSGYEPTRGELMREMTSLKRHLARMDDNVETLKRVVLMGYPESDMPSLVETARDYRSFAKSLRRLEVMVALSLASFFASLVFQAVLFYLRASGG